MIKWLIIILLIIWVVDLKISIVKTQEDVAQLFRQDRILIDHIIELTDDN